MKVNINDVKLLLNVIGYKLLNGENNIYYKKYQKHNNYIIKVDFENEKMDYGKKIELGDLTTSNFENSENFVVFECVNRLLEKGYSPDKITLEQKWPMGRREKGKLDILVKDIKNNTFLMIECKTWDGEFNKEKKRMRSDGGQLFSYFQQDKSTKYLCLYTSAHSNNCINYQNEIVKVEESWKELNNQKEVFDHWNKNFYDNGIFDEWTKPYNIEIKALTRSRLREITNEDSGRIFNQFAEILRHNIVSDKPNAFNKILNLFLCKIVDEDRKPNDELKFQWLDNDTDEELQKRLSDLYKQGMKEYLTKEVTDYNDNEIAEKLYALDADTREQIKNMFTHIRLYKNNEFAFKEVFDIKSFRDNAKVVREVVELLQPFQIRYGHKQQFLGDFFELLLSTGLKQEAGQFFTPVPIAKFIVSSLPIKELIEQKISGGEINFLPYVIDYAVGSGHFLTEVMDDIQKIIETIDYKAQRPSIKAKLKSWHESPFDWACDYIYGIEADYRLVKTAKVSCFLNGDGMANVIHADGLDNFKKSVEYKGKLKEINSDDKRDNEQFDILIANPPYSVKAFKNNLNKGEQSFELFSRLTDDSSEIECLFVERTKQLLREGGWAGIILPSTILTNPGIYISAREIILKYFNIKAIVEFGSKTFMATGTNTIALFLERRSNNDWKKIEIEIKRFFLNKRDFAINNIENAFSEYIHSVYENLELADYFSLINHKPNDNIKNHELFKDYENKLNILLDTKILEEEKDEIRKTFYDKIITSEQEKMLYYFLVYHEECIVVNVGEGDAEKDFLGYEFSNRKGKEGIKMFYNKDGTLSTRLFDNEANNKKLNYYIYNQFLNAGRKELDNELKNNVSYKRIINLLDFSSPYFQKNINIKTIYNYYENSRHPLVRLKDILSLEYGKSLPEESRVVGKIPVMGSNGIVGYHNKDLIKGPAIVVGRKGSAGKVIYETNDCFPIDTTFYVINKSKYPLKMMYYLLLTLPLSELANSMGVPGLNRNDAYNLKVPLITDKKYIDSKLEYLDRFFHNRHRSFDPKKNAEKNEKKFSEEFIKEIVNCFL
jgi:type I restriction enzyme M protein